MIAPHEIREALGWLSDLPSAPCTDIATEPGRAWLTRLNTELVDAPLVTGAHLVAACRALARKAGAFHPTPGQIVAAAVEERAAQERRRYEQAPRIAHDELPPPNPDRVRQIMEALGVREKRGGEPRPLVRQETTR